MREFRTSGSVGAPASNRRGDPTTRYYDDRKIRANFSFPGRANDSCVISFSGAHRVIMVPSFTSHNKTKRYL